MPFYVVRREVDGTRFEYAVFETVAEARQCYQAAAYVCDNGPDEDQGSDPTIVSNCWLFAVNADDVELAKEMARDGRVIVIDQYA